MQTITRGLGLKPRAFLFMTERDFRKKFKELTESAQSEDERPTTLRLVIGDHGVMGQIRSNTKVLFHYPENFNPQLPENEFPEVFLEAKHNFGRRITHSPYETSKSALKEYGYIV